MCRECEMYKNERLYDYNFCPTCGSRLKDGPILIPTCRLDDQDTTFIKPHSVRRQTND